MVRNPFTRAALAGIVFPLAVLACGGKGVSIGSNSEELRSVDPKSVSGSAGTCAAQQAHPNVCCHGGPDKPSECVAFVNSPFHACKDDWKLYPDPTQCCDLNDPSKCGEPPPPPPPGGGGGTCAYACAPGWWPVLNNPGECCQIVPGGNALECTQVAWGYGDTPVAVGCATAQDGGVAWADAEPPPIDGGPAPDADIDGGVVDGGPGDPDASVPPGPPPPYPPPDCDAGAPPPPPPPWPQPICNTPCPVGFSPLPADPSICCAPQPNGGEICFSQAVGPVGPPTPVPGQSGGGAPGSSGGSGPAPGK